MVFNRFKKSEERRDVGFGSDPTTEGARLLNKDGTSNVQKDGISFLKRFSLFHTLINMNWVLFFGYLFLGFTIINVVFAFVYVVLGVDGINGTSDLGVESDFLKAFLFSTQTLTTVGYGQLNPGSTAIGLVSAVESFVGLLGFAMATGLLYGKFSKPRARLIFSDNALVAPYNDTLGIMVRLANAKSSQIIDVKADMFFAYKDKDTNGETRKFYTLPLELNRINMLATSWTLVHPLDENSPLDGMTEQDLIEADAELLIQIQGFDVTYNQQVNTRTSYKAQEFIWNAKFVRILGNTPTGKAAIDLGRLSEFDIFD